MNFLNLLLVFLIATSCIKVGENEENGHHRSSLRRKIYQKECKSSLIIEKCFAYIERQSRRRDPHKSRKRRLHRGEKVGPFLIFSQLFRQFFMYNGWSSFLNLAKNPRITFENNKLMSLKLRKRNSIKPNELNDLNEVARSNVGYKTDQIVLQRTPQSAISDFVHKFQRIMNKLIEILKFGKTIKRIRIVSLTIFLTLICQNVELNPGPSTQDSFSVLTYNCNGLGDKRKLKRLLVKLTPLVNKNYFILLQETHIINDEYLKLIWKHKFVINGLTTNSAGVITLFNNKYDLKHVDTDNEGRRIVAVLEDEESKFIIANSYFPNDRRVSIGFAESLFLCIIKMKQIYDDHIVISGGDFNVCLSQQDQLNRKSSNQERELARLITENNKLTELYDSYRSIHPSSGYTWKRAMTFSRLDYVFVSKEVLSNIVSAKVDWAFENSDHAAVTIKVKVNTDTTGPGSTKLNAKILNNPEVVQKIESELSKALAQSDENWNPHMNLEYMKVMIRSIFANETSRVRSEIKAEIEDRELTLNQMQEKKIRKLENTPIDHLQNHNQSRSNYEAIVKSIEFLTNEIRILRNKFSETMAFSAKAKWYEKGEKSNKYFLNLNTMRQSQKLIGSISDDSGEFKGQSGVMDCIKFFYETLYKHKPSSNISEDRSFYNQCPELTEQNKTYMEQELTLNDLKEALKTCKPSSPGPDGIPYEIYKTFWKLTGPIIFKSWLYSIESGILAPSQLESTIVLLPKVGKDCKNIKNWRPITLSNCDLKIVTKALSLKMSKVLDQIIVNSQVAYIPGRSVTDNLRTNFYFKQYCKSNKCNSVLISLDAKKAFDSVDHKYIKDTLHAYGFGPNLISTFKVLYNKITARILVNGFQSDSINIERGVKQGDALSCAIFIICIDPLIRNINYNENIKPIIIRKKNSREKTDIVFKAAAYADDISIVCTNSQESIQHVFNEYSRLTKRSGLELNADKTEILRLDADDPASIDIRYEGVTHTIKPVNKIKICGLFYCSNIEEEYQLSVLDKIDKLEVQVKKWSHNNLTMEGKNLIIKTFGLSQMIYNMQAYRVDDKELIQVERIIFGFLWSTSKNNKGIDRISRKVMKNDYSKGGLMITDMECLDRALKTRQFIRASKINHPVSKVQAFLTNRNTNDNNLSFEYCYINPEESICCSFN